ncbi:MAG: cysteine hydrolase [Dehalococcoidia bacterium]|jgi:nicotinamidase-related amidase|nr:cysteine hydrolase [Dehalococcoidia bacterium]
MAEVIIDPGKSALLLQDLQNDLLKGSRTVVPLNGAQVTANCRKLLAKAREVGMPVIYVRVSRRPDLRDAPRPPFGTPPGSGGVPDLIEGSVGAEVVSELAPSPEDAVVTKHTTSPFNTTDIEVYLRRFGVSTLILAGYSTTGVVEGSLRDARDKDYDCVVVRDCCAAGTVQEHDTCMDIVFPRMAWVAGVDQVIDAIKG